MGRIIYCVLLYLICSQFLISQITTSKIPTQVVKKNEFYDSTMNYVGVNPELLIKQKLYLKGQVEFLAWCAYHGFVKDYKFDDFDYRKNIYKPGNHSGYSSYDSLMGRYFLVQDVIHEKGLTFDCYLQLFRMDNGDQLYFEYKIDEVNSFPFVVVGYFEYQKKILKGRQFIVMGKEYFDFSEDPIRSVKTGKEVDITKGETWTVMDLTIEQDFHTVSMLLENDENENIVFPISKIDDPAYILPKDIASKKKKKFGRKNWSLILKNKVKIGMTKDMCELAWGKPNKVNKTKNKYGVSEQWVYESNYLYFDNNKLTSIQ